MKRIVFDASTLISISEKCFINVLKKFHTKDKIDLIIPEGVYRETVEVPIHIRRFELNAVRIKKAVEDGWIKIKRLDSDYLNLTEEIENYANKIYNMSNSPLEIIHRGETETLAIINEVSPTLLAIDERNTRMLIEEPLELRKYIEKRYEEKVTINKNNLSNFQELTGEINIVRSVDLMALAFERGYFEDELDSDKTSLEAALFSMRYSGCAISLKEIEEYLKMV